MNITATADIHGSLGSLEIPEADVLVIAGDVCPTESHTRRYQEGWLVERFLPWCEKQPVEQIVWVAGNHDFVLEDPPEAATRTKHVHYLEDSGVEIGGVKFWGSPWVRPVGVSDWAFSIGEEIEPEERDVSYTPTLARSDTGQVITMREHSRLHGGSLAQAFARIPDGVDVLVTHCPPFRACDSGVYPLEHLHYGSRSLRRRIEQVQPQLAICGHIHDGFGASRIGETTVFNVAHLDAWYRPTNPPVTLEVES